MLRCKQVADALADKRYWELPWYRRWGLRLHVGLCFFCGRYHRHVMCMQETAKSFCDHEAKGGTGAEEKLSPEARERIKQACRKAT